MFGHKPVGGRIIFGRPGPEFTGPSLTGVIGICNKIDGRVSRPGGSVGAFIAITSAVVAVGTNRCIAGRRNPHAAIRIHPGGVINLRVVIHGVDR